MRTHPDRSWTGALRLDDSQNFSRADAAGSAAAKAGSNGAFDGVQAGYDVIEAHIRRARAVAAQYAEKRTRRSSGDSAEDLKATIAQIFRTLSDLAPVVGELVNTIGAEGFAQALSGINPFAPVSNGNGFTPAAARVVMELSSKRPIAASCDLRAGAERLRLMTRGLEARSGQRIAPTALTFAPAQGRKSAALRIRLPDAQSSGIYCGMLFDQQTGEPQGIVTVRVAR